MIASMFEPGWDPLATITTDSFTSLLSGRHIDVIQIEISHLRPPLSGAPDHRPGFPYNSHSGQATQEVHRTRSTVERTRGAVGEHIFPF